MEKITLGGGCFWCTEAIFKQVKGVTAVESGYAGGTVPHPTYEQVCSGSTGHAEVVEITFDPSTVSLHDLLTIFFTLHDPTTINQQGADIGTQYRSVILYRSAEQRDVAEKVIDEIEAKKIWSQPVITTLEPFTEFYPAEGYHQDYYEQNPNNPYCRLVIAPKVAKLRHEFLSRLAT